MERISKNSGATSVDFWNAVKIYFEHPNSINKQILKSEILYSSHIELFEDDCIEKLCENFNVEGLSADQRNATATSSVKDIFSDRIKKNYLCIQKFTPKPSAYSNIKFIQFSIFDFNKTEVIYYTRWIANDKCSKEDTNLNPMLILKYKMLKLNFCNEEFSIMFDKKACEKARNWITSVFLLKFSKLMSNTHHETKTMLHFESLIDATVYYKLYEDMKSKYASHLIKNWCENTDPKKYVYEDIGIATYLMLLWNDGQADLTFAKKQKFVDLGCGNGLLVFILNSEGHQGIGLDVRKRKIWSTYPSFTILKEETVVPTSMAVYPDADWLIGNHSDELTAWIPIMAARSNITCQYFVLPCCPFRLNGLAYQRQNSSFSVYQDFINYVHSLSLLCGYETFIDKLRIPSTKRICLVGRRSGLDWDKYSVINDGIISFINDESRGKVENEEHGSLNDFKARDSVVAVRNCTKLSSEFLAAILIDIMNILLREKNFVDVTIERRATKWNRGLKISINGLANQIPQERLHNLKEECKGLQTLLKNHHYLFEVKQGEVQFRSPQSMTDISQKIKESGTEMKWKQKICWFQKNHPDGCPLPDSLCSYKHELDMNEA